CRGSAARTRTRSRIRAFRAGETASRLELFSQLHVCTRALSPPHRRRAPPEPPCGAQQACCRIAAAPTRERNIGRGVTACVAVRRISGFSAGGGLLSDRGGKRRDVV